MEREAHSFHRRVRAAYLGRAKGVPGRIRVIDSSRPLTNVRVDVDASVVSMLDPDPAHRASGR
jgi:dTMP kinase